MDDFDFWNEIKKGIEAESNVPNKFSKEAEVWMSSLGRNVGYEQNGSCENFSRPIIFIKKFNNHMFWVAPLSSKQKQFDFYYNYTDPDNQPVSAILAQLKLMSVKRFKRKLYSFPAHLFIEMKKRLKSFL